MNFDSIAFAVFLPVVFLIYWIIPQKYRWSFLLAASYYFYMSWNPKYVVLILGTTVVSYFAAIWLEKANDKKKKKHIVAGNVIACLGVLFVFKYFNFFSETFCQIVNRFSIQLHPITLSVALPVGISFYTFQTLSYVIDVYRGKIKAERNFGIYATYISFFPQLVAGPIERSENLLPQIKSEKQFDYDKATYGLKQMAWGFFKKMAIADFAAVYVNRVYAELDRHVGFDLVLIVFLFTIEIYCDFSGYSDIAIGTAKLFGVDLMTNFKSPYFSKSIKEFWSRWHISLSSWFKDYLYIPLGGNRCSKQRNGLNLIATFLVSGLWHGASLTYVAWGGLHGFGQLLERAFGGLVGKMSGNVKEVSRPFKTLRNALQWTVTFLFVNLTWVFFRAETFEDAGYIFVHMIDGIENGAAYFHNVIGLDKLPSLLLFTGLIVLVLYDFFSLKFDVIEWISKKNIVKRWLVYLGIVWLTILIMPNTTGSQFIYFQF